MTPNMLYGLTDYQEGTLSDLVGFAFDHLAEANIADSDYPILEKYTLVKVRIPFLCQHDARRYWRVATVWYDTSPVMVCINAGREGDDYVERYVTNAKLFEFMIRHLIQIKTLYCPVDSTDVVIANPDQENRELTRFYGHDFLEVDHDHDA